MMISIYYRKEDEWLLKKVDKICARERRSRSAVILSLLEQYFEREKKIGEILQDMGFISLEQLQEALELQKREKKQKKLGQILKGKGIISEEHIQRIVGLQRKTG
jgi:uncharacterized protein (DUF433 family)